MIRNRPKFQFRKSTQSTHWIVPLLLLSCAGSPAYAVGWGRSTCDRLFRALTGKQISTSKAPTELIARKVENLDELLSAFTQGLEPDLSVKSQRDAFELYRRMRFGNPDTRLNPGTVEEIAGIIKKHPELEKLSFRDFKLEVQERNYPVTPELANYLDSQVTSAGQTRANLFQIEANSGYWKKVFQYEEVKPNKVENLSRDATVEQKAAFREYAKRQKEEITAKWTSFLEEKLPTELRNQLLDPTKPPHERAAALYHSLKSERESLAARGKDIRPVSQAIVDLVHTIGYHDPAIAKALRSENGMERLIAYRKVLDERDRFAMELGFEGHFDQILNVLGRPAGVTVPTGVPSADGGLEVLKGIEKDVVAGSTLVKSQSNTRTIRQLSLVESPFRSCLGGSDCSSRTYLSRALDPNYLYFTLTDETGASSGQITVVLGTGKLNGKRAQVAFVDKVQNVANSDLPQMMEGIRRSLEEKGYLLALPDNMGNHNGLSNEEITRSFVEKNILTDPHKPLTGFEPLPHSYNFPNIYSRATSAEPCHLIAPLKLPEGIALTPGVRNEPWKVAKLDMDEMIQASINLKNSPNPADRLRYLPSMKALQTAFLKSDPDMVSTLNAWLMDSAASFQLRKQALLSLWIDQYRSLPELLSHFNRGDQVQYLQNLLDTPRYRDRILSDSRDLVKYIVIARGNENIRDTLLSTLLGERPQLSRRLIVKVLETKEISDDAAETIARQTAIIVARRTKSRTESLEPEIEELVQLASTLKDTKLASWINDEVFATYSATIHSESSLARALTHCLSSEDPSIQKLGQNLLAKFNDPKQPASNAAKIAQQILEKLKSDAAHINFSKAAEEWVKAASVEPALKTEFLLSNLGLEKSRFNHYLELIPPIHSPIIRDQLEKSTYLDVFKAIAQENPNDRENLLKATIENGKSESFQFRNFTFKKGGETFRMGSPETEVGRRAAHERSHEVTLKRPFEMQVTPVTQLQWSLVMGSNPSTLSSSGKIQKLAGGRLASLHPNRPVEQVSWEDIQEYLKRLNQLDSKYTYRLPTEAEWEYAARAGTDTAYPFPEGAKNLDARVWHKGNSDFRAHDVATRKPNSFGMYDMLGNVWERAEDVWVDERPQHAVDPTGPSSGTQRAIRGGSFGEGPENLRSASRFASDSKDRKPWAGFRLVRTLKSAN